MGKQEMIQQHAGTAADISSVGILTLAWANVLPAVSTVIVIAYTGFRLYTSIILWKENRAEKRKKTKKRK